MHRILSTRLTRLAAASFAGLILAGPLGLTSPASAAPVIDRNQPAPTANSQPDPFYTPPAVIPADAAPGDILRARPAKAGPPTARSLADAWQVMYRSTDANGNPNVVTGTILVPKGVDRTKVPVVAMNPGTTGPAFRCTVSRFINSGAFYEQAIVNGLLKAGYAVSVTDYEGYHENPETTYILGRSMGPAVLDGVRAATRLPEAGLSADPKVLTQGFSQGGAASMWAGQLAPTYAPELDLIGVSAGGVPSDLIQVSLALEGSQSFGFLLNALIGLDNAYAGLNFSSYFNAAGSVTIPAMEADDCTVELLLAYEGKRATDYLTSAPYIQPSWFTRLQENKLGSTKINVPVYQYHATNDPIVPFAQAKALRDTYCGLGMSVQWNGTFTTGHVTTVARGNADALKFIADRVAGRPATPNCGS